MTDLVEAMARAGFDTSVECAIDKGATIRLKWEEYPGSQADWRRIIHAALTALEQSGLHVVPVEPTEGMVIAADNAARGKNIEAHLQRLSLLKDTIWPAMLAAAPKVTP